MDWPFHYDARDHFDDEEFVNTLALLRARRQVLVAELSKVTSDRLYALRIYSAMLHTIQDFYSHSTWVREKSREGTIVDFGALTKRSAATPDLFKGKPVEVVCTDSQKTVRAGAPVSTAYYEGIKPEGKCIHGNTIASVTANCAGFVPNGISLDSPCQGDLVRVAAALAKRDTVVFTQSIIDELLASNPSGACTLMGQPVSECASGFIEVFEFRGSTLSSDPNFVPIETVTFYQSQSNRPGTTTTTTQQDYVVVDSVDPFRVCRIGGSWMPKTETSLVQINPSCAAGGTCSHDVSWMMDLNGAGVVSLQRTARTTKFIPHLPPGTFSTACGENNSHETAARTTLDLMTGGASGVVGHRYRSVIQLNQSSVNYCGSLDRIENRDATGSGTWSVPRGTTGVPLTWSLIRSLPPGSVVPPECSSPADEQPEITLP